jgi:peptide deformylase
MVYSPAVVNVESQPVHEEEFVSLKKLRGYMIQCMRRAGGVGLAAPQVGLFKSFIIVETSPFQTIDLINPYITKMYGRELEAYEGCPSLPPSGNHCLVPRLEVIQVEASSTAEPWIRSTYTFQDQIARIVQHEIDHLTGTFFVDRVSLTKKKDALDRFTHWKNTQNQSARISQRSEDYHVDSGLVAITGRRTRLS